VEHYLAEITRVLKPGGRSLSTFFLLNEESSALTAEKKGTLNFEHHCDRYRTINAERPEDAVAYPEDFIRSLYRIVAWSCRSPSTMDPRAAASGA
jgi:hypothetical protein